MMPAANQGVGMNTGFPDVCTTPMAPAPVPIPYPNIGMNAMSMPFIPNILVSMAPAQNMGAKPMMTNGDNAGVAHPLFMQPGGTTMGNPRILMGGMPSSHLLVPTYGNNFNNPVGSKLVPSVTNVLLGSSAVLEGQRDAASQLHREAATLWRTPSGVAVLRIPCIGLNTDQWLAAQLGNLRHPATTAIALDLRHNPGGSVATARKLAQMLAATGLPITIATSSRTASSAELLTALLQDQANALVFGETSYGKVMAAGFWCGQDWLLPSGDARAMLRPNGTRLPASGIQPDVPCDAQSATKEAVRWLEHHNQRAPS